MIRQLKINLQVKSDPLIYRKLTKSAKICKYPIQLLASPLALRPLATFNNVGEAHMFMCGYFMVDRMWK